MKNYTAIVLLALAGYVVAQGDINCQNNPNLRALCESDQYNCGCDISGTIHCAGPNHDPCEDPATCSCVDPGILPRATPAPRPRY